MTDVFIIPDVHLWYRSFENRIDYPEEVLSYLMDIEEQMKLSVRSGNKAVVIFSGDVFHRGYNSAIRVAHHSHLIDRWASIADLYSVIGNHEINYASSNMFWALSRSESSYYNMLADSNGANIVERGINVVDELVIDNVLYVFGHYGRTTYSYDFNKYCQVVFITHNAIMDVEVRQSLEENYNRDTKHRYMNYKSINDTGSIPQTTKLKYMYVGHMHTAYSRYNVVEALDGKRYEFVLQYLGSLGRTNILEIDDNDLNRIIPIHHVDGIIESVTEYQIRLKPRSEIVIESVVEENQEAYSEIREIKKLKSASLYVINTVGAIEEWLKKDPRDLDLFHSVCDGRDEIIEQIIREVEEEYA